jgi:hypothetical protein
MSSTTIREACACEVARIERDALLSKLTDAQAECAGWAATAERFRDLLRRVLDAPCDTSGGEYPMQPVWDAMNEHEPHYRLKTFPSQVNAELLAECSRALEEGKP